MKLDAFADHSSFIDFINEFSVLLEVTTLAFAFLLLFFPLPLIIISFFFFCNFISNQHVPLQ